MSSCNINGQTDAWKQLIAELRRIADALEKQNKQRPGA